MYGRADLLIPLPLLCIRPMAATLFQAAFSDPPKQNWATAQHNPECDVIKDRTLEEAEAAVQRNIKLSNNRLARQISPPSAADF